jgi:monofunctional biosynthetic peptidoglycan transglycosylase
MESIEAAALAAALSTASSSLSGSLPPELEPFPPLSRRRWTFGRVVLWAVAWILALHLCYLAATTILISVYKFVDPPATVLMAYRKWRFGWDLTPPRPVHLAKVPRYIRSMLVAIEDDKFYVHHGIDLEAVKRAREIDKKLGKPLYGGSTLTMQVARTLFLVPEKSYLRKYLEVQTALELEALLSKSRILELYFGYAEWGKGIFGMEAAARKWYGVGLGSLSRDQAARLIALLSSPIKYRPGNLQKSRILRERYDFLSQEYDPSVQETEATGAAPIQAAKSQESPALVLPPPSPEPGADVESDSPADTSGEASAGDANPGAPEPSTGSQPAASPPAPTSP